MRTSQPQTIFLKDYRVPAFLVDHVDLRFELFEDGARVHCTLAMRRNPDSDSSDKSLELDGDSLTTLESVSLDGNPWRAAPTRTVTTNSPFMKCRISLIWGS